MTSFRTIPAVIIRLIDFIEDRISFGEKERKPNSSGKWEILNKN